MSQNNPRRVQPRRREGRGAEVPERGSEAGDLGRESSEDYPGCSRVYSLGSYHSESALILDIQRALGIQKVEPIDLNFDESAYSTILSYYKTRLSKHLACPGSFIALLLLPLCFMFLIMRVSAEELARIHDRENLPIVHALICSA